MPTAVLVRKIDTATKTPSADQQSAGQENNSSGQSSSSATSGNHRMVTLLAVLDRTPHLVDLHGLRVPAYPVENPRKLLSQGRRVTSSPPPPQHPHASADAPAATAASPNKRKHEMIAKRDTMAKKRERTRPKLPLQRPCPSKFVEVEDRAYVLFKGDMRPSVKRANPDWSDIEVNGHLSEAWVSLCPKDKDGYLQKVFNIWSSSSSRSNLIPGPAEWCRLEKMQESSIESEGDNNGRKASVPPPRSSICQGPSQYCKSSKARNISKPNKPKLLPLQRPIPSATGIRKKASIPPSSPRPANSSRPNLTAPLKKYIPARTTISSSPEQDDPALSTVPVPSTDPAFTKNPLIMADPPDKENLTQRICFLRHQIEFFEATAQDVGDRFSKGGTKTPVTEGQIGIRCIHCAHLPDNMRANGAVAYPATLATVYQAVRNWQRHHFMKCEEIPQDLKDEFSIHTRRHSAKAIEYWVASCKRKGLYDGDNTSSESQGIRLKNSSTRLCVETRNVKATIAGNEEHLKAVVAEVKAKAQMLEDQIVRRQPDVTMREAKTNSVNESEYLKHLEAVVAEAETRTKALEVKAQRQHAFEDVKMTDADVGAGPLPGSSEWNRLKVIEKRAIEAEAQKLKAEVEGRQSIKKDERKQAPTIANHEWAEQYQQPSFVYDSNAHPMSLEHIVQRLNEHAAAAQKRKPPCPTVLSCAGTTAQAPSNNSTVVTVVQQSYAHNQVIATSALPTAFVPSTFLAKYSGPILSNNTTAPKAQQYPAIETQPMYLQDISAAKWQQPQTTGNQ